MSFIHCRSVYRIICAVMLTTFLSARRHSWNISTI